MSVWVQVRNFWKVFVRVVKPVKTRQKRHDKNETVFNLLTFYHFLQVAQKAFIHSMYRTDIVKAVSKRVDCDLIPCLQDETRLRRKYMQEDNLAN